MPTVVLLGSLDTKGAEYEFLRERLVEHGWRRCSSTPASWVRRRPPPTSPRPTSPPKAVRPGDAPGKHDRGDALAAMTAGATSILRRLHAEGRVDGVIALGGTGGTSVASAAFRELPLGVPKLIVSTAASGATAPYVAESDLILVPSVTDVAGLNRLLRTVIANAAAAMAGMVSRRPLPRRPPRRSSAPACSGSRRPA